MDQAREGLRFQTATMRVSDEAERALGTDTGGMWLDWSDHRGRLKIAVASETDPGGPRWRRPRRSLAAGGVLDRTDFIAVKWTLDSY